MKEVGQIKITIVLKWTVDRKVQSSFHSELDCDKLFARYYFEEFKGSKVSKVKLSIHLTLCVI